MAEFNKLGKFFEEHVKDLYTWNDGIVVERKKRQDQYIFVVKMKVPAVALETVEVKYTLEEE